MSKWKFWQRNKSVENSELPEEVREYYASTRKSRTSSAWLLGFATLLLTLALAVALYFAGKFIYEQFFVDDNAETTAVTEPTPEQPQTSETQTTDQENNNENPEVDNSTPTTIPGGSVESDDGESTSGEDANSASSNLTETPDTGPGNLVAVFIGTTLISAAGYELVTRKKITS